MANTSLNTTAAIRQQVYSSILQKSLDDELIPEGYMFDVSSELVNGDTLNMPTVGDMVARSNDVDGVEEADVEFDALDTGRITLTVNKYDSVAWYSSKKLEEDQYIDIIGMQGLDRAMRAMKIKYESNSLAAHNAVQTAANLNSVNGAAHRYVAGGSGGTTRKFTIADFAYARYSLDKANVPDAGRIAIVDPSVALTLDNLAGAQAFNYNPAFEGMVTTGFRSSHRFIRNIEGIDIYVSNRLPKLTATEAIDASGQSLANDTGEVGDAVNLFFSVAADDVKPVMCAWRRRPLVETWVQQEKLDSRIASKITARYGFATHRPQGLVCVLSAV